MLCCAAIFAADVYSNRILDVPQVTNPLQAATDLLALTETELGQWMHVFQLMDRKRTGRVTLMDLFEYFEETPTPITKEVFMTSDVLDREGMIEFGDFVRACAIFCLFGKKELIQYVPPVVLWRCDLLGNRGTLYVQVLVRVRGQGQDGVHDGEAVLRLLRVSASIREAQVTTAHYLRAYVAVKFVVFMAGLQSSPCLEAIASTADAQRGLQRILRAQ
jgi:hypothetical protein